MNEAERSLLYETDKHVGVLAKSMEQLVVSVGTTNDKLTEIFTIVNSQNVLTEKISNMEEQLKDSFGRYGNRLEVLEMSHNTEGCVPLRSRITEISILRSDITDTKSKIEEIEKAQKDNVSSAILRWSGAIALSYMIVFGTYMVKTTQELSVLAESKIQMQRGINNTQTMINGNNQASLDGLAVALDALLSEQRDTARAIAKLENSNAK